MGIDPQTRDAIKLAGQVLRAAVEKGRTIPKDIAEPISRALNASPETSLTTEEVGAFWTALSGLSTLIQPMSVSSLVSEYQLAIKRQYRIYVILSLALLLIMLPLSICGFLVTSLDADITKEAEAACASEPGLRCGTPWESAQPDPTISNNDLKRDGSSLNYIDYAIYKDVLWLNSITFLEWYPKKQLGKAYKCVDRKSTTTHKTYDCSNNLTHSEEDIDFPATFGGVIYFARRIKFNNDISYGILGAYILPPLYAMLGACAFGLRNQPGVSTSTGDSQVSISVVRILLAALAGFVVGLFNDATKGLALSPLALAFVVGYSADLFFSFMDSIIQSVKGSASRAGTGH